MKKPVRPDEEATELCAAPSCARPALRSACACEEHWALVPTPEQIRYRIDIRDAICEPDVQRARRDARLRVGAVLRGVRA